MPMELRALSTAAIQWEICRFESEQRQQTLPAACLLPLLTELPLISLPEACCGWMLPSKPTCQSETGSP